MTRDEAIDAAQANAGVHRAIYVVFKQCPGGEWDACTYNLFSNEKWEDATIPSESIRYVLPGGEVTKLD